MLSNIKAYQSETATQRCSSQNSPLCCTTDCLFTKGSLLILTTNCHVFFTFTQNALILRTGWPTKWIKKQIHGFGWFLVSTERWKETAPWKRKFRFSVKANIYLKPCICLKSENMNTENEGTTSEYFWNFWNLAFQNEKMDGEWTDLNIRNITSPHIGYPPPEIENILTSTKNPKFQLPH